jgi:hypothetical protein
VFKILIGFNRGILSMPIPWQLWMVLLVTANLVLPFFFLDTPEAIVVLVGAGAGLVTMMIMFAKMGYVKLLGIGHIPWLFTIPWLWSRLAQSVENGPFYYWLLTVIVLDSISLVIDSVDVIRYWQGERQPTITAE